ncbi:4'-phosphopantetheinyl transferase superfamily protein [Dermatophilus congolensis]|uniref:4'-phosphopantetheinyl transferase superfamily protein n=1 Tax=Dermatophilus congolensis TaxID=1863 RepID=UPI001AAE7E2C|nr:4'-phosphopantetheinyl transferase superfamily protein [Dermatophilus congolensis]MBO3161986.1 4'-phosphopantetheinyl transferase superfamily protein [Dermatophilus congolensis]MBO3175847.1 4'-phosphopantetheinyl transferase superfamily protein [Dermatophilus congolensis]MBO3182607.1 4'-phosphopantetheinyl transferase superfamily protein [Dermatophilus congolensis]MBO3202542.1 4'-phosphopantetheinyl transferase superfamily protein [Dermatophilus congolensis]
MSIRRSDPTFLTDYFGEVFASTFVLVSSPCDAALTSALLTQAEKARVATFRRHEDAVRHASGRLVARYAAALVAQKSPESVTIVTTEGGPRRGQPVSHIGDLRGPFVSIAHAGSVVAAAASSVPCGVDVEAESAVVALGANEYAFTRAELASLSTSTSPGEMTRWWTAKEAVAKAVGTGFLSSATAPGCMDGRADTVSVAGCTWRLTDVPVPAGYRAVLALPGWSSSPVESYVCDIAYLSSLDSVSFSDVVASTGSSRVCSVGEDRAVKW